MNESEFQNWANDHAISNEILLDLKASAALADQDSLVGRAMLDYAGIAEITDDIIIDSCPFDAGFIVFGDCPNGDPIAIDVQNSIGTIHYLSHEETNGGQFPSIQVAKSMKQFLKQLACDKLPTDYHEALGWDFSQNTG